MKGLIGRKTEITILCNRLESKEAEFIAVYGRRRVGKTFLVKTVVNNYQYSFLEASGLKNGTLREQLANFMDAMAKTFHKSLINQRPKNWKEAFLLLTQEISRLPSDQTVVVFLDELPWLATPKSKLIQHIDYFWNNVWSSIPTFKLIVCGSAAAWMLEKLIHSKGGLYNRITSSILLSPFSLHETEQYLISRKIKLNYSQIVELYMVMGGVPHYLKHIEPGKSAIQNVDQLCFTKDGILYEEFARLFESLFDKAHKHENIVRSISKKRHGISRMELLDLAHMKSGGAFDKIINELEASGFIKRFVPYGKTAKDQYFRIIDEYTMFYLQWIASIKNKSSVAIKLNYWHTKYKTSAWESWSGYAFESICYKHIDQIITKLGITDIGCTIGSWRYVPKKEEPQKKGAQIDLLFDRDDDTITVCEIKYNDSDYILGKQYAMEILERNKLFCEQLRIKKQIFTCFITNEKVRKNLWSEEIVDENITTEDLFK
jgi:hypothetical protein